MSDPISDMLTRIKNGYLSGRDEVVVPYSKFKEQMARVLKENEYISDYSLEGEVAKKIIKVNLLYRSGKRAIEDIKKVSKPSVRVYARSNKLPKVLSGYGISIISTSKGLMSNKQAQKQKLGGEVVCKIW